MRYVLLILRMIQQWLKIFHAFDYVAQKRGPVTLYCACTCTLEKLGSDKIHVVQGPPTCLGRIRKSYYTAVNTIQFSVLISHYGIVTITDIN